MGQKGSESANDARKQDGSASLKEASNKASEHGLKDVSPSEKHTLIAARQSAQHLEAKGFPVAHKIMDICAAKDDVTKSDAAKNKDNLHPSPADLKQKLSYLKDLVSIDEIFLIDVISRISKQDRLTRSFLNKLTDTDLNKEQRNYLKIHFDEIAATGPIKDAIYIPNIEGSNGPDEKAIATISGGNQTLLKAIKYYIAHTDMSAPNWSLYKSELSKERQRLSNEADKNKNAKYLHAINVILNNFDKASLRSQPDRSLGITEGDLRTARKHALEDAFVYTARIAANNPSEPPKLSALKKDAVAEIMYYYEEDAKNSKDTGKKITGSYISEGLQDRLNKRLMDSSSPYKFKIKYEWTDGVHGKIVRSYSISILDQAGETKDSLNGEFDTVAG